MSRRDLSGRLLLSVALISVAMAPLTADLNDSHIFNGDWPPHARFHTAVLMFLSIGLSLIGLWLVWRRTSEFRTHLFLAMLIPVLSWGSFFLALMLPGTGGRGRARRIAAGRRPALESVRRRDVRDGDPRGVVALGVGTRRGGFDQPSADSDRALAMRLLVVGATGALGRSVVDSGLAHGHDVNALVRNPGSAGLPGQVQVIKGDVLDAASMEPAVAGCAAVICALGTPSPRKPTSLLERGTANLVAVMTRVGVSRLVCVTLLGVGGSRPNTALPYRHVILRVLAPMVPDKEGQEQVVRDSGLDWVLVRPPTIVGFAAGHPARVIQEGERGRVGLVSRKPLADLLVRAAATNAYGRQAIAVGR